MKILKKKEFLALLLIVLIQFTFIHLPNAHAATNPNLGTAATYSILAGSEVTNTGTTTISRNVGISPGIGLGPHYINTGTVTLGGTIHDADGAALTAQADKNTAYDALASQGCVTSYAGTKDLAGETLVPGVYCADSFHLTGTLTLNGSASDVWIFKSASDLILTGGTAVKVVFTGNGQPCNVWWRVVSTATFDANSTFVGNILADTSITFAAGASLDGRALARTAEVTLSSNSITGPTCATSPTPTPSPTPGVSPTPSPSPTPEVSPSPTPQVSSTPEVSPSPTPTPSPTPGVSPTPSPSPTPEVSPSPTPQVSSTPVVSPTPEVSPSPTPQVSSTPEVSPSPSSTSSPSQSSSSTSTSSSSSGGSSPSSNSNSGGQVLGASTLAGTGQSLQLLLYIIGLCIMSLGLWHAKRSLGRSA